jgi:hypothetical protein
MLQAAAELKKAGVTFKLIDNKEYFHHCVGALRASVFPGNFIIYKLLILMCEISQQSNNNYHLFPVFLSRLWRKNCLIAEVLQNCENKK